MQLSKQQLYTPLFGSITASDLADDLMVGSLRPDNMVAGGFPYSVCGMLTKKLFREGGVTRV